MTDAAVSRLQLVNTVVVGGAFLAVVGVWLHAPDGSQREWVAFVGALVVAVAVGAAIRRRGLLLAFAPAVMAIPLGTTNYDSGAPDAIYVLMLGTPLFLILILVGMGLHRVADRIV
jgi:hypothetical protein